MKILEQNGNIALLEKENTDIESRDTYVLICALNYQCDGGLHLYDNGAKESVKFQVSSQAPQEVKEELLQIARRYFNSISQ